MKTRPLMLLVALAALCLGGCKPKAKEITSLQRKEAATLVTEAQFALQLKDYARAEGLMVKATTLCPDTAKYWIDLGSMRVRMGQKENARTAYKEGLSLYEAEEKATPAESKPLMMQIYALALLGRVDDARATLARGQKKFPEDRTIKAYAEGKQIDKMIADPRFKEIAL